MPRTTLPPTPAASTEIQGREDCPLPATDIKFNLGPPAIAPKKPATSSVPTHQSQSDGSNNFTLPPPPTRSRTIIQMKPKSNSASDSSKIATQPNPRSNTRKSVSGTGAVKKQPSSTSAAGKKIARKTAHSVIERRRRSKMNEEFATLKGMIPACTDQEMHKLAILQVSRTCDKDFEA